MSRVFPIIGKPAFTLVELLVVLAVVGLLVALAVGGIQRARAAAEAAHCASNLRQLYTANNLYAAEYGHYVPAASDLLGANNQRWHGARSGGGEPFDGARGPLAPYLGGAAQIRACPAFQAYEQEGNAFEASCGAYGYNDRGVGSQAYLKGFNREAVAKGMPVGSIAQPAHTVMFCDTAFPQPYDNPRYLIEYSFAEAYHFVRYDAPVEGGGPAQPSIHFRHAGRANVVWCDGHVTAERLAFSTGGFAPLDIGWFGPRDNTWFDPF